MIIKRTFYTNDGKTEFVIHNVAHLNQKWLNQITKQTEESYEFITHYFKKPTYNWAKKIDIKLMGKSTKASWGLKNSITLYNYANPYSTQPKYRLTHELTHTLLGYGVESNPGDFQDGFLTQEGLADYFQEKLQGLVNGLSINQITKYMLVNQELIPLKKLLSPTSASYFRANTGNAMFKSYIESASFVGFLIEKYGRHKFYLIYNQPHLQEQLKKVYGKSPDQLISEWKGYLNQNIHLTKSEKNKLFFYYLNRD